VRTIQPKHALRKSRQRLFNPLAKPPTCIESIRVATLAHHSLHLADESLHADDSLDLARIEVLVLFDLSENRSAR